MKNFEYNKAPQKEFVKKQIELLSQKTQEYKKRKILKNILNCIDLTSLNITDNETKILDFVNNVNNFKRNSKSIPNVAAICVYPNFVETVKTNLKDKKVNIASVGASFPSSQTLISIKAAECELIKQKGADEIDIVISIGAFLNGDINKVSNEIKIIKGTIQETHLKVILETGELNTIDNIYLASIVAMESGADFIKTSTGKTPISATPEAVYTMCLAIKEYYLKTGKKIGVKPSGGIVSTEDAIIYYQIVEEVLGAEWLNNKLFRLGASRLANNILDDINKLKGKDSNIPHF